MPKTTPPSPDGTYTNGANHSEDPDDDDTGNPYIDNLTVVGHNAAANNPDSDPNGSLSRYTVNPASRDPNDPIVPRDLISP